MAPFIEALGDQNSGIRAMTKSHKIQIIVAIIGAAGAIAAAVIGLYANSSHDITQSGAAEIVTISDGALRLESLESATNAQDRSESQPTSIASDYEILVVHSETRSYVEHYPEEVEKVIEGINEIQTGRNWENMFHEKWIRVRGAAGIYSDGIYLENDKGAVYLALNSSDLELIANYPDGTSVTAEGTISSISSKYTSDRRYFGVLNGSILEIHE